MGFFHNRLLKACEEGDIDAARRRLRRGLDVNAYGGEYKQTPLIAASFHCEIEMVRFLLDKAGADVNATDGEGYTPLFGAEIVTLAELFLSKGADIHARNQMGDTPLHFACSRLNDKVVSFFLSKGASVDIENVDGQLPIDQAMRTLAASPYRAGAGARILQDFVRRGARMELKFDEYGTDVLDGDQQYKLQWQRVGPALRFAVNLWREEHRLGFPLTQIPEEEIEKGLEATQLYVKERKASKHIVCRRTICVVGPSTAGKTSLIKSLIEKRVCLEHIDDRTIGIDHFVLEFDEPNTTSSSIRRTHEVKFSDFAGQDVYQGMHSLFFTRRTLFLVCIDLNAYSVALLKYEMLTPDDAKLQHMMNEYVDRTVLSWIRIILGRQPNAEFVFVCTKEDTVSSGPGVDKEEVLAHVKMMLGRVIKIVEGMTLQANRDRDKRSQTQAQATQQSKSDGDQLSAENRVPEPITHLWDVGLEKGHNPTVKMIVTDATTASTVQFVRSEMEQLIVGSGRSYETPEKYMRVLKALIKKKEEAAKLPLHSRIRATLMNVDELIEELQQEVPDLKDEQQAKTILQTLRDCVDILWYEDMKDTKLQTTVMLDPRLLIEFLRQVINHKHVTGVICHATLSGLSYWRELNTDQEAMLAMKKLLQTFRLVHPASGEMACGSDLIVPAYWKTNLAALWVFGGEDLRLNPLGKDEETVARRVHWEFRFTHFIPETLFDHLVVAAYSSFHPLQVGPDWILYRDGELAACRVMISHHWKTHERSLLLEAVLSDDPTIAANHADDLWGIFTRVCNALACVLQEYPGLAVTSFAHSDIDGHQPSLSTLLHEIVKGTAKETKWMPPKSTSSHCVERLTESALLRSRSIRDTLAKA